MNEKIKKNVEEVDVEEVDVEEVDVEEVENGKKSSKRKILISGALLVASGVAAFALRRQKRKWQQEAENDEMEAEKKLNDLLKDMDETEKETEE